MKDYLLDLEEEEIASLPGGMVAVKKLKNKSQRDKRAERNAFAKRAKELAAEDEVDHKALGWQ